MAVCRECYRTKFSEEVDQPLSENSCQRGNRLSSPFAQMMKSPLKPNNNSSMGIDARNNHNATKY